MKFTELEKIILIAALKDNRRFYADLCENPVVKKEKDMLVCYNIQIKRINELIDKIEKGE